MLPLGMSEMGSTGMCWECKISVPANRCWVYLLAPGESLAGPTGGPTQGGTSTVREWTWRLEITPDRRSSILTHGRDNSGTGTSLPTGPGGACRVRRLTRRTLTRRRTTMRRTTRRRRQERVLWCRSSRSGTQQPTGRQSTTRDGMLSLLSA